MAATPAVGLEVVLGFWSKRMSGPWSSWLLVCSRRTPAGRGIRQGPSGMAGRRSCPACREGRGKLGDLDRRGPPLSSAVGAGPGSGAPRVDGGRQCSVRVGGQPFASGRGRAREAQGHGTRDDGGERGSKKAKRKSASHRHVISVARKSVHPACRLRSGRAAKERVSDRPPRTAL